ncbi:MAG TPA: hypothetical protein V6D25_08930 [Leptolyngbyaceae cyanobacterium]
MDWSNFNLHGDAPDRAFESLTGIIFERWCYREYPSQVSQVIFVNGSGGDGGVEAYALLNNGDIVGLQAKWFREPLESSQISQINGSLDTASVQRRGLVRYVVAVPRDLSDVRKTGKNGKRVKTERDRWNEFLNTAKTNHPGITVDLWDETRITDLLAELGSEGLRRYWFEGSVIDVEDLHLKFNQAQNGWLRNRYTPDLHQSGQIEQDLNIRLNGPGVYPAWLQGVTKMRNLLEDAQVATTLLRRYPEFMDLPDAENLIQAAQDWLMEAIAEQVELEKRLSLGNSFPVPDIESKLNGTDTVDLQNLINVLLPEETNAFHKEFVQHIRDIVSSTPSYKARKTKKIRSKNTLSLLVFIIKLRVSEIHYVTKLHQFLLMLDTTKDIGRQLDKSNKSWGEREITPQKLRNWGQPVLYIGDPGVGKTDALANAVQRHLAQRKPAVLIRARDVDLAQSWDLLLANAIGQPTWNLRQVLDALESAATQAEVRSVANAVDFSGRLPVRVLIAIDGLDETTSAESWAEKLGELAEIAQKYPRILFVFSVRPSLVQRISLPENINCIWLRGSDAPLAYVFEAHCQINDIQCPPHLRWALKTPLAIRLFAELYQGQRIEHISLQNFSLVKLIQKKIENAERSIREREGEHWPIDIKPVRSSLRAIAKTCFTKGAPLEEEEVLQAVESAQIPKGILNRSQLLQILNQCRDHGLLLRRSMPSDDLFAPEINTWEPAYETLTDFLLAWEAYQNAKESPNNPDMPPYLVHRPASVTLAVYLLEKDGHNFFDSELWKNNLTGQRREDVKFTVLSMIPSHQGEAYREWVLNLFSQDMPTCSRILELLIVPGLRIPGYIYGAKFVHDALLPMGVAERDLFWSGPHQIPHNHGAKWEGYASAVLEELELSEDDPWDSAPLLLAWATTTVNNDNRRRIRSELAAWGHNKPSELLALIQTAFQTNDPQMREDLLLAAYGASFLVRPSETWLTLCEWIINSFFTPDPLYRTHNLIIRHCARSLVERCLACGVIISGELLTHLRKPDVDPNELLPLDTNSISSIDEHHGISPATMDLAWYVVPQAIEPFFNNSHFARMAHATYSNAGKLPQYSTLAQAFLTHHAKAYDVSELTPNRCALAFVRAYALSLGWSEEIFIGNPQGGNPGEILGADIAISRKYGKARHGEQSSMASFGEKYVWAATHELTGFLADRVTAYDWNHKPHQPPVNLAILAEFNNPATDIGYGEFNSGTVLAFSELIPDADLTEPLQIDRVNEWIQKAPLPAVEPLVLSESSQFPEWAQGHEWLVLKAFVRRRHIDSQAESNFWASSFVFPSFASSLLENNIHDVVETRDLYDFKAIVDAMETYQDPGEVVWASWIRETEGIVYPVVDNSVGQAKTIPLLAGTCKVYWRSPDGEAEEWLPAKWLRRMLGVVDFRAGKFLNASGEILAFTIRESGESGERNQSDILVARRDVVTNALKIRNLSLAWGIRLYREPSYPLIMLSDEKRMYRDWCATLFCAGDAFKLVTSQDLIRRWVDNS